MNLSMSFNMSSITKLGLDTELAIMHIGCEQLGYLHCSLFPDFLADKCSFAIAFIPNYLSIGMNKFYQTWS